jgi:hypothetical protein
MTKFKLSYERRQRFLALMHEAYADNPTLETIKRESPEYHRAMAALYRARLAEVA